MYSVSETGSLSGFPVTWVHICEKQSPVFTAEVIKRIEVPSGRVRLMNSRMRVDFPVPSGA